MRGEPGRGEVLRLSATQAVMRPDGLGIASSRSLSLLQFAGISLRACLRTTSGTRRHVLAVRGLTAADLARLAHISAPTISQARHGRSISARTFKAVVRALADAEPLPGSMELLAADESFATHATNPQT